MVGGTATARGTDRKSHLCNAAEEHLEQGEEEEARVQLAIGNAVRMDMCAQEKCGCDEGNNASLHEHKHFVKLGKDTCEQSRT